MQYTKKATQNLPTYCIASPYDTYWGSGLKINHPECWDMAKWGENGGENSIGK